MFSSLKNSTCSASKLGGRINGVRACCSLRHQTGHASGALPGQCNGAQRAWFQRDDVHLAPLRANKRRVQALDDGLVNGCKESKESPALVTAKLLQPVHSNAPFRQPQNAHRGQVLGPVRFASSIGRGPRRKG